MKQISPRSDCPVSFALDILGDKWSLLILRDVIFADKSSYGEFLQSEEGIATNILADRLTLLEAQNLLTKTVSPVNKSRFIYTITEKGIELLPVIMELMAWGVVHGPAGGYEKLIKEFKKDRKGTLKELGKLLRKKNVV